MRLMSTVLFWLLCGVAVAEQPGDFAFGMPIEVSGTQALFEVELPAAVHDGGLPAGARGTRGPQKTGQ